MTPPPKSYIVRAKRTVTQFYEVRAASPAEAQQVVENGQGLVADWDRETLEFEVESVEENE